MAFGSTSKSELEIILSLTDQVSKNASGVKGALGDIAKIATGILASQLFLKIGQEVVQFAGDSINAASNLNEALNATSVVFGDAASTVQDFGNTAAEVAGLSAAEFNQMAAQTGAMLQNYGLNADEAATSTINLATRAADMASIFNTDVSEAFVAINAALRGEADPIERFGVSMNAAAVEAQALAMGFEKVNGQFSAGEMTQARLALLFEQTNAIAGDFVNTSDQLANATRVQQAKWENFMAQMGSFFLPIVLTFKNLLADIGEVVMPIVLGALEDIMPIVQGVADAFGNFVEGLLTGEDPLGTFSNLIYELALIFGATEEQASNLFFGFQELVAQIQAFLEPIITAIGNFVSWKDVLIALGIALAAVIIPAIITFVASMLPIIATVAAIIAIIALLRNAWENDWGGIRTNLTAWWTETGSPIFENLKTWLGTNIPAAIATLKNFWLNVLLPAIQNVWDWITGTLFPLFVTLWDWLSTNIPAALETLADFWTNTLKPALDNVWAFIQDYLFPLFVTLVDFFNAAFTLALTALAGLWQNVLKPALSDVWAFIQDHLLPILESIRGFIADTLGPKIQEFIDGPVGNAVTGFIDIRNAIQWVIDKVQGLIDKLKNFKLPPVLQPGSPTPFELGLRGIADALDDITKNKLPDFGAAFDYGSLLAGFAPPTTNGIGRLSPGEITAPMTAQGPREYHLHIYSTNQAENLIADFALLEQLSTL